MNRNCWGCGEKLDRVTDEPLVVKGHAYCRQSCVGREYEEDPNFPIDYDAQDRRAASEERIALFNRER